MALPLESAVVEPVASPERGAGGTVAVALLVTLAWPAAAAVSLAVALGGYDCTPGGLLLLASGTTAAYGLDRLIDNRSRDPRPLRRWLIFCVAVAALATAALACTAWWRLQVCVVLAVIAGLYVPLKTYVPKNLLTTVAWTLAAATLPFAGRPPMDATFHASVAAVALIMAANTMLCDIPDTAADRAAGVRGIAAWFGPTVGAIAAAVVGVAGAVVSAWVGRWGLTVTAGSLAVLAVLLGQNPRRRAFRLLADAIVTVLPGPMSLLLHWR
jgi:4-hydroxybenzoate polyprenyltransferase